MGNRLRCREKEENEAQLRSKRKDAAARKRDDGFMLKVENQEGMVMLMQMREAKRKNSTGGGCCWMVDALNDAF